MTDSRNTLEMWLDTSSAPVSSIPTLCSPVMIDYDTAEGCSLILCFGKAAQDELLCQVGGCSLAGVDEEVAQE